MSNYKNRHRIWLKAISMVVVCLFTINTISWAYPGVRISSSRHTLAPRSIFKPLTDEGIPDTAEIKYEIIAGVRLLLAGHSPTTVNGFLTETYRKSENKRKTEFLETVEKKENSITAHFKILGKNNVTFEIKYQDTKTASIPEGDRRFADDVDVKDAHLKKVSTKSLERLHYGSVFQENDVIKITKIEPLQPGPSAKPPDNDRGSNFVSGQDSREAIKKLLMLKEELKNPDEQVQKATFRILGRAYAALIKQNKMSLSDFEAKLKNPDWRIQQTAFRTLTSAYIILINEGKEVPISLLEAKLKTPAWWGGRKEVITPLTSVYTALIKQGKMSLSDLEAKLKNPNWHVRGAAFQALSHVYAALISQGKEVSLSLLEAKLRDPDDFVQNNALEALTHVYIALINQGKEVSLSLLEAKLKDPKTIVQQTTIRALGHIYAALINQGKEVSLSLLEEKLRDSGEFVRLSTIIALGHIYAALINQGKEVSLSLFKKTLENSGSRVRPGAIRALGNVYVALINQGKEVSLSLLEAKLKDAGRDTPESAIQALGNVYVALINQGKEVSLSLLEAELKNPYRDIREAATQALGNAYAALVGQGKMSLFDLEAKLKDPDQCIREIAIQALDLLPDLLYAASINRSIISDADYEKYLIWTQEKLPYDEEFVTKYLSSPNPRVFISKLKAGAQEKIDKGFDPNNEEETYLAFIGARINGIDMTFAEFKERLEELVKFDKAHPGYFSRLFSKAKTLRALEVSAEESRTLDASQVDTAVLDKNLAELMKIKEDLDSLEWPPEDFRDIKAFNINNLYRYFRKEQGKPKKLNVSISDMKQEISQNLPMFRKALFKLAKRQLSNKKIRDKCLVLMRNLIIADVLSDNALLDHMRFSDVEAKISAFKNFYENYKNHLPNSVNVKLERIKGLPEAFGELSEAVFNEIGKVKVIRQKGKDTYTLIPQGFLSVFRGRAGMIDCSFDADKGTPCTRAMHEDTIYYFVYKGKKLKGYVGLCVAKTAKGEKLLTIDTINSASLDGEELLTNLFKELNTLTQELGCTGIALPSDIKLSFNFDNKETIKKMRLYTKGKAIRAGPFHKDTWQFFTDMFGEDGYNSIEKGEFKLINIAPSSQAEPVWLFDKLLESDSSENVGEKIAQFVLNTDVDLSSERDVYRWFTGKMGFGDEKGHGEIISSEEGIEKWRKEFQEDYVPSITDDKGRLKKEYEWWGNWLEFFHPTDTFRYDYRIYFVPKDECVITTFRNLIEALKESGTGFKIKTINIEKEMNEKLLKGQARTRKDRIVMYFSKADADKIVELVYSYVSSHKEDFHDWEAYFGQRIVSGVPGVRIVSDPSKEMCEACDASDQTYNCVIARITVAVIQKILRDNKEVLKKKLSKRYMNEVDFIIELFIHYIGSEKSTRLKQKFGVDMIDEIFNPFIRDAFKVLSDHFGEKEFHRLLTDIYKEHLMGLGMDPSRVAFLRMQPDPAKPTAGSTEGKPASDENTTMDDSTNAGGMSVRGIGTLLGLCIGLYFDAPGLGIAIGFLADVITYLITRRIRRASREKSQGMYIPFHFPHTIKRAFKTEDIDTLEKIALGPDSKFPVYAVHALMRIALPEGDERSDKAWKAELALEKIVHEKPDLAETIVTTLLEIYRSGSSTGKYRTGRILSRVASNNPKLARKTVRAFEGILEQENLPNIEYDCAISAIKNFITSDNEIFSKSDLQVIAKAFEKREMKEEFYSKVADAFTSLAHVKPYLFADKSDKRTKHAAQVINILEKTLRKKGLEPKSYWYIIGALTEIIKKDHELIKTSLITALEDILKTKGLPGDVYQNAVNCLEAIHALKPPFAPIVFRTAEKVLKTENLDKEACERTAYLLRFLIKASPKIATRNTINILRVLLGKKDLDNYVIFTFCLGFIAENNPGLTEAAFRAFKDVLKTRGLTLEIFKSACTVLTNVAEKRPETVETVIEIFIEVLKTKGLGFDAYSAVTSSLESIFSEKTELITLPAIQRLKSTLLSEDIDPDARKALSALVQIISEILKEFSMAPPESLNLSTVEMLSALFPINGLSHTTYDNLANSFLIIAIKKPDEARKIVDILAEAIKIKGLKQYIREKSSSALTTITSIASDDLDDKELADKIVHTLSNILLTKDLEHSSYKIAGVSLSKIADNPEFTQKVVQILKNLILMKDLEKEANEEAIGSLANIVGKKPALSAEIVAFFEDILREEHPLDPETHKRAASCWLAIVQKNSDASPDKAAFLEKLDLGFLEFILAEDGLSSDVYDYAGSLLEKIAEDKTDEITKNTVTALLTALKRRDMEEGTYWKITACLKKIIEKTGSFNEAIETFCKKIYKEKDLNVETYRCAGRCIAAIFKEDENTRPEILEFLKEVLKTKSLDPSAYDGAACGLKDIVGVDVKSIDSSTCGLLEEVMSYDIPGLYLWAFYIFYIISYIPNMKILEKILNAKGLDARTYEYVFLLLKKTAEETPKAITESTIKALKEVFLREDLSDVDRRFGDTMTEIAKKRPDLSEDLVDFFVARLKKEDIAEFVYKRSTDCLGDIIRENPSLIKPEIVEVMEKVLSRKDTEGIAHGNAVLCLEVIAEKKPELIKPSTLRSLEELSYSEESSPVMWENAAKCIKIAVKRMPSLVQASTVNALKRVLDRACLRRSLREHYEYDAYRITSSVLILIANVKRRFAGEIYRFFQNLLETKNPSSAVYYAVAGSLYEVKKEREDLSKLGLEKLEKILKEEDLWYEKQRDVIEAIDSYMSTPELIRPSTVQALEGAFSTKDELYFDVITRCFTNLAISRPDLITPSIVQTFEDVLDKGEVREYSLNNAIELLGIILEKRPELITINTIKPLENAIKKLDKRLESKHANLLSKIFEKKPEIFQASTIEALESVLKNAPDSALYIGVFHLLKSIIEKRPDLIGHSLRKALEGILTAKEVEMITRERSMPVLILLVKKFPHFTKQSTIQALNSSLKIEDIQKKHLKDIASCLEHITLNNDEISELALETLVNIFTLKNSQYSNYGCNELVSSVANVAIASPEHMTRTLELLEKIYKTEGLEDYTSRVASMVLTDIITKKPELTEQILSFIEKIFLAKNLSRNSYKELGKALTRLVTDKEEFAQRIIKFLTDILKYKDLDPNASAAGPLVEIVKSEEKYYAQIIQIFIDHLKTEGLGNYNGSAWGLHELVREKSKLVEQSLVSELENFLKKKYLTGVACGLILFCVGGIANHKSEMIQPSVVPLIEAVFTEGRISPENYHCLATCIENLAKKRSDLIGSTTVSVLESILEAPALSNDACRDVATAINCVAKNRPELIQQSTAVKLTNIYKINEISRWTYSEVSESLELILEIKPHFAKEVFDKLIEILSSKTRDPASCVATIQALEMITQKVPDLVQASIIELLESVLNDDGLDASIYNQLSHTLKIITHKNPQLERELSGTTRLCFIWFKSKLPFFRPIYLKYINSPSPEVYLSDLLVQAMTILDKKFDFNDDWLVFLAYSQVNTFGVVGRDVDLEEFKKRLKTLQEFEEEHPGHIDDLFKDPGRNPIRIDSEGSELNAKNVDIAVLNEHLVEIQREKKKVDDLSMLEEILEEKYESFIKRVYAFMEIQEKLQKDPGLREKIGPITTNLLKQHLWRNKKRLQGKNVSLLLKELASQERSLFYKAIFFVAHLFSDNPNIKNSPERKKYIRLMRLAITSDGLESNPALVGQMQDNTNRSNKITVFKNFYEDHKNHLPDNLGLPIPSVKGLAEEIEEFTSALYEELEKGIPMSNVGGYVLKPVNGFVAVFRGRAGIIDCSYEDNYGVPYTRAMHEDTSYLFVYNAKGELKGYIGLLGAEDKNGRKILTVDTIQSASLNGEPLLIELLEKLHKLAKSEGFEAIALPSDLNASFNFDNKDTIQALPVYEKAKKARLTPIHEESWDHFTDMFGRDRYNSIENGRFMVIDFSDSASKGDERTFPYFSYFSDTGKRMIDPLIGTFDSLDGARKAILSENKLCYARIATEPTIRELKKLVKTGNLEIGLAKIDEGWLLIKGLRGGVIMPFNDFDFKLHSHPKRITKEINKARDVYIYPDKREEDEARRRGSIEFILSDKGLCAYGGKLNNPVFIPWKELESVDLPLTELHKYFIEKEKTQDKTDMLFVEHADEKYLLSKSIKHLRGYPINMYIDLSTIPNTKNQLEKNMEILARLIAWHNALGLDIRYILERDVNDKALLILKNKLKALSALPGVSKEKLLSRLGPAHTGKKVIGIKLKNLDNIGESEHVGRREYMIALKDDTALSGIQIPNYTAASALGLSLAALRIAKEEGDKDYKLMQKRILKKFKKILKRFGVNTKGFTIDVLELIVTGSSDTKLYYAELYALPPLVKHSIETINKYHETLKIILQAA